MFRVLKRDLQKITQKRCYSTLQSISVRAVIKTNGGQGFPPATMNMVPSYFRKKIEEK